MGAKFAGDQLLGQAVTDKAGYYEITGLEENRHDIYSIYAKGLSEPPEWEGQTVIDKKLKAGDNLSGIDILLHRTMASRQKEWLTHKGEGLKGNSWITVLDDYDPACNFNYDTDDIVNFIDFAVFADEWDPSGLGG